MDIYSFSMLSSILKYLLIPLPIPYPFAQLPTDPPHTIWSYPIIHNVAIFYQNLNKFNYKIHLTFQCDISKTYKTIKHEFK